MSPSQSPVDAPPSQQESHAETAVYEVEDVARFLQSLTEEIRHYIIFESLFIPCSNCGEWTVPVDALTAQCTICNRSPEHQHETFIIGKRPNVLIILYWNHNIASFARIL